MLGVLPHPTILGFFFYMCMFQPLYWSILNGNYDFLMSHCNFMFCLFPFFHPLLRRLLLFSRCFGQFGSFAISRHPTTIINRHTGITLSLPFSFSLSLSLSHTHSQSLHFAAKWCIMGAGRGLKRQWSKLGTRNSGETHKPPWTSHAYVAFVWRHCMIKTN